MRTFRKLVHNRTFWQGTVFAAAGVVWLSFWLVTRDWAEPMTEGGAPQGRALQPEDVRGHLMGLGEFGWPERNAWLEAHGIEYNAVTAEQLDRLRQYYVGSNDEREKLRWECTKTFGLVGEKIESPRQENLGCLGWRMERLTSSDGRSQESDVISLEMHARRPLPPPTAKPTQTPAPTPPQGGAAWAVLAKLPYKTLIDYFEFKTYDEARVRVREAKAAGNDCSQATARAALMAGLEDFLPSREAWQSLRELYALASPCLPTDHEAFERVHLRMGLLHLERRELRPAAEALAQAQRAKAPKDEARSHFWLGFLNALKHTGDDGVIKPHSNPWWDRVLRKLPLGVHALAVHELMGEDPVERLEEAPRALVSFYEGRRWDAFNLWSFLFVLAEAQGMQDVQVKLMEHMTANFAPRTFETGLYVALVYKRMEEHRASIQSTLALLRRHGIGRLTPGVLSLLFPLHYEAEMERQQRCGDKAVVLSIIRQESSFFPRAMDAGAQGLMQIQPAVAQRLFPDRKIDLLDPAQNIEMGCAYLDYLGKEFDGNLILALAAYNAGTAAVRRWQQRYDATIPLLFADLVPYASTRYYIANVLAGRIWYDAFLKRAAGKEEEDPGLGLLPEPGHFSVSEARELSLERWAPATEKEP